MTKSFMQMENPNGIEDESRKKKKVDCSKIHKNMMDTSMLIVLMCILIPKFVPFQSTLLF